MTAPKPFNIMSKPIGPRCNIDCSYCYYLEKEKQFPDEKKFRMSDAVLETYVRELIMASEAARMPETTFAWQGGEPTMLGVDFFERAVALQKQYAPAGMKITNAFQTNGILLDEAWGHFLHDNGFLVGISIDGPKQVHDRYRLDRAGRPTFDRVMKGLEVLQEYKIEHNALTVVHRANSGKGKEIYRFLKGLGIEFMQFIPIVERSALGNLGKAPQIDMNPELAVTPWSASPKAYGKFLCEIFDIWFKRTSARSLSNISTPCWASGWVFPAGSVFLPKPAVTDWRWNITAIFMPAITSSIRSTCWATSPRPPCRTCYGPKSRPNSAPTSAIR